MKSNFYTIFIIIAIAVLLFVVGTYYYNFKELELSSDQSVWGAFGDYIGGTLNPIFALLSFIALLSTIRLQSEELGLTREELEKSSKALMEQSDSFKIQNNSIKQQNFENTFFKMIDLHNDIVNQLVLIKIKNPNSIRPSIEYFKVGRYTTIKSEKDYYKKEVLKIILEIFNRYVFLINNNTNDTQSKEINVLYDNLHFEYQEIIGHYFGNIYQILKFINESNIENKKRYSSLYRAQFSLLEIDILAYHCISHIAIEKFKPLIEEYEFLEHIKNAEVIERVKPFYSEKAFGKNII